MKRGIIYRNSEIVKRYLSMVTAVCLFVSKIDAQGLIHYVQPLSGTAPSTTTAALKHSEAGSEKNANTIPAVGLPFGMTQWTSQTRLTENKCIPPYFYKDSLLTGFRATHWLSGSCTQDYGSFTIMPVVGTLKTKAVDYAVPFSHSNETTSPAYYKLDMVKSKLAVEMTTTLRCGMMQFTMEQDDSLYLLVLPNSDYAAGGVRIDRDKGEVVGYNPVHRIYQGWGNPAGFNGHFFIQLEKKAATTGTFSSAGILSADSISDQKEIGAYIGLAVKKGEQVRIRIGTSFSSSAGAKNNLDTEMDTWDFNALVSAATAVWEKALNQVTVRSSNEKNKRLFYTAMYHAMQHPRLYNDADGTYPKFAGNNELMQVRDDNYYDDFSMWDIYRAQLPLFEILQPQRVNDFVSSLVTKGTQGGWLPIFPCWNSYTSAMIGDHATAVIASAYAKGIRNYNVQEAYRVMRQNAFDVAGDIDYTNGKGRRALTSYLKYHYIPMEDSVPVAFHKKEQVSRTLEYAYDDYALSVVARSLNYTSDYKQLHARAFNYKNVFDKNVGMVRGRYADGSWYTPFSPDSREPYITEGTPRQYTLYVPQDVHGLATLMGGDKQLENALDSLFTRSEYWHGNEPGHQIPFMYNYTPSPWKTQQLVTKILSEEYTDGPGGLSGNDDAGQMSAWYIFAAMGFYPVDPISGQYVLTTPLFDDIQLKLENGKIFQLTCHKKNENDHYIKEVRLNGKMYTKNFIQYTDIMKGAKLEIYLQSTPSAWGSSKTSRPKGLSD